MKSIVRLIHGTNQFQHARRLPVFFLEHWTVWTTIHGKRLSSISDTKLLILSFLGIGVCPNSTVCDVNGVCAFSNGEAFCSCKAGFSGDGRTCAGLYLVSLLLFRFSVIVQKFENPETLSEPFTILHACTQNSTKYYNQF